MKLLGFSRGEMMGKTIAELSPFKDLEWAPLNGFEGYEQMSRKVIDRLNPVANHHRPLAQARFFKSLSETPQIDRPVFGQQNR